MRHDDDSVKALLAHIAKKRNEALGDSGAGRSRERCLTEVIVDVEHDTDRGARALGERFEPQPRRARGGCRCKDGEGHRVDGMLRPFGRHLRR